MTATTPNVKTVNEMTTAIFDQDHDALAKIFTDDLVFHLRGPDPMAGDHTGVGGLLGVDRHRGSRRPTARSSSTSSSASAPTAGPPSGSTPRWRRNGNTLESRNAFVYRFDGDRIAEMWMFLGAPRDEAEAFFA